jgi:hypothetical protein
LPATTTGFFSDVCARAQPAMNANMIQRFIWDQRILSDGCTLNQRVCSRNRRGIVNPLVSALDEAFDQKSWHGTNLRGSIRRVTAVKAVWRPGPGRHNIWEIALHCAYWKYTVWRQLSGAPRASFPLKGSNFWVREEPDEKFWALEKDLLVTMHGSLRGEVEKLRPEDLAKKPSGGKYTREFLIRGVAAHDLYHAGQIQLIKRLI